ncbi:MAG: hypothetical protein LBU04_03555 [Christensenellaceae bacterium]|nr:hypothetical protein [Christensenellaceae bacterium]
MANSIIKNNESFFATVAGNEVLDDEFFTSYAVSNAEEFFDIPHYWKFNMPVILSTTQRIAEIKRQKAVNKYIKQNANALAKRNSEYRRKLLSRENEFKHKIDGNDKLLQGKLKELELAASENAERLQYELITQEERLREIEQEKQELLILKKNEERIKQKQMILLGQFDALNLKVNETINRKALAEEQSALAQTEYHSLREENLQRAKEHPELPVISRPMAVADDSDRAEVALNYQKRISDANAHEIYDKSISIEFKNVFLKKSSEGYILNNVNFSSKRGCTTIIFSNSTEKLLAIKQILFKSLSSDTKIINGLVRINGIDIGSVPRDEYRGTIGKYITGLSHNIDFLVRSNQNIKHAYKNDLKESEIKDIISALGISPKLISTKVPKISEADLHSLALAGMLAMHRDIKLLDNPETLLSPRILSETASHLKSKEAQDSTLLILTESDTIFSLFSDAKVYTI